jgi:hypothetical protein
VLQLPAGSGACRHACIEFSFILAGHPSYANVFDVIDIPGYFGVYAGRRPVLLNGTTSRSEIKI